MSPRPSDGPAQRHAVCDPPGDRGPAEAVRTRAVLAWHLDDTPTAARLARRQVRLALTGWVHGDLLDDIQLVVSELVTNAVEHGAAPIDLTIQRVTGVGSQPYLDVTVADGGHDSAARPVPRCTPADMLATSGRGLHIVAALATRWGVVCRENRTIVWSLFRLRPESHALN
jgi:anti-sigma regulatory factor (Ser/Thr protein kinase)